MLIKRIDDSIVFCVIALLSILSVPVIGYIGGRQCCPLIVAILPAEIVPVAVWLLSVIMLVVSVVRSLVIRRHILLRCAALVIVLISTMAFFSFGNLMPFYLYGLRDRFEEKAGYANIREFANEVSQNRSLLSVVTSCQMNQNRFGMILYLAILLSPGITIVGRLLPGMA